MKIEVCQRGSSRFIPDDLTVIIAELFDESSQRSFYTIKTFKGDFFLQSTIGWNLRKNWSAKPERAVKFGTYDFARNFAIKHFQTL